MNQIHDTSYELGGLLESVCAYVIDCNWTCVILL